MFFFVVATYTLCIALISIIRVFFCLNCDWEHKIVKTRTRFLWVSQMNDRNHLVRTLSPVNNVTHSMISYLFKKPFKKTPFDGSVPRTELSIYFVAVPKLPNSLGTNGSFFSFNHIIILYICCWCWCLLFIFFSRDL